MNDVQHTLTHRVERITPELAQAWLEFNTINRPLREIKARSFAHDMATGDWELNGETIKFADDGSLIDGQHRLTACVLSRTAFESLVVGALPVTAQASVDKGTARSFGDTLAFAGEVHTSVLAALLRRITSWESGVYIHNPRTVNPTESELLGKLAEHTGVRGSAAYGVSHSSQSGLNRSVMAFMHWLLTGVEPEEAVWFLDRVHDGAGLEAGHPVLALRERLRKERAEGLGGSRGTELVIALVILAWNMHGVNLRTSKILLPKGGLTNDSFPQPKKPRKPRGEG